MAEVSLSEAATRFVATLKAEAYPFAQGEVNRFVRWYGASRPISELRGHEVSLYGEVLGPATAEASRRADQVRAFLVYLKKEGLATSNLAPHLRLRKSARVGGVTAAPAKVVELTREGLEALQAELESLLEQRPRVREEIRRAMQDKDFRENAPLDAAKEKQAHMEARIREIEATLKKAVIVEDKSRSFRVRVGSQVVVRKLPSGETLRYTVVGMGEASGTQGKISSESPVGKALLGVAEGDEVEVSVPAGVLRLRVEGIEG